MASLPIVKIERSFCGGGEKTDRDEMNMDELEIENKKWIKKNLKMKNGLIKWTVKDKGEYEFHLESRSTNWDWDDCKGPAMGVNIELKINLKKVNYYESHQPCVEMKPCEQKTLGLGFHAKLQKCQNRKAREKNHAKLQNTKTPQSCNMKRPRKAAKY